MSTFKGFTDFVREQGVVGLAVGLAIGTAAGAAVASIVDNLINPIIGFILGKEDLSNFSWTVIEIENSAGVVTRELTIGWGAILSATITLIATALVIYLVVKQAGLDKLDKKSD